MKLIIDEGIGIIQLPCPELLFKGISRPPMEYADYDTGDYRKLCTELLAPYVEQLKNYLESGYRLLGVLGIQNSPSCSISGKTGVFMEELLKLCKQHDIRLKYAEIPEEYNENIENSDVANEIINLIKENEKCKIWN